MDNTKNQYSSIRKKLTAAVAMLLVAAIMVVTSTYAWFTLSTAPEVTGITTTVGANGNLEIALAENTSSAGIKSGVGDSMAVKDKEIANITWGNLVDLSSATYGLNQIKLYPAALNLENGKILAAPLKIPEYGNDGRISQLLANTVVGTAVNNVFTANDAVRGVRAIGTASDMTPQQIDYRNSKADIGSQANGAKSAVATSLNTYGSDLASIMMKHAIAENDTNTYNVASLEAAIQSLETANASIAKAIKSYYIAVASTSITDETEWAAAKSAIDGATLDALTAGGDIGGVSVPAASGKVKDAYDKYVAIATALTTATSKLGDITDKTAATWTEVSAVVNPLIDTDSVTVNGLTVSEIRTDKNALINSIAGGAGITVSLPTGSGVYADFADLCGDYSSSITLKDVEYNSITLDSVTATMKTASTVTPSILTAAASALPAAPAGGDAAGKNITDSYGYVLDFWFRTNAAESNLLLQTEAANRIYKDGTNEDVMGGGSTMSFTATDPAKFTTEDVKNLMGAIRIVFASEDGTVLSRAMLKDPTTVGSEVTSKIVLFDEEETTGEDGTVTKTIVEKTGQDAVITALTKNTPQMVSVYVYLDGDAVDNSMVANAESSMTGSMNLQFASSATLTPMNYTPLQK